MAKRNIFIKNDQGFTLIEIIAVLIIMGILAAVAVPKYFALTVQAETKEAEAVTAEIQARANNYYAQQLLAGLGTVAAAADATWINNIGALPVTADFANWAVAASNLTKTAGGNTYTISVLTQMAVDAPAKIQLVVT